MSQKSSSNFKYEEGIERLEQLWFDFNQLIPTHDKLVEIKRELKIRVNAKSRSFLSGEYPDIEFLKIGCLKEAVEYIYDLNPIQIRALIALIETEKEQGIFYSSMRKWIRNSIFEIKRCGSPKQFLYSSASIKSSSKKLLADELLKQVNYRET